MALGTSLAWGCYCDLLHSHWPLVPFPLFSTLSFPKADYAANGDIRRIVYGLTAQDLGQLEGPRSPEQYSRKLEQR